MKLISTDIKQLPQRNVVAFHHKGDYSGICAAFEQLAEWAAPKGLFANNPVMIAIYHDDPCLVPVEQLRSSACLVVDESVKAEDESNNYCISCGKYFVAQAELSMPEFTEVWQMVYKLLKEQGFECDCRDHYELYLNDPETHPQGLCLVDFCIPVK